tara:strand:- start:181 stop:594 length:414 start_codon:yes stop_codon:yes gene_type:complete
MYESEVEIRVRYAETDRMGYCYYGNYAQYFEVARVESLRSLGFSYKKLEDSGILLPVKDYSIKYIKPAYYDDLLKIKSQIVELPAFRINFKYQTYNQKNENINFGQTTLVFVDSLKNKPVICPEALQQELKPFFYEK